ncbi:MAG: PAC2 family protein [Thermodesulfobacteriota bacterium]
MPLDWDLVPELRSPYLVLGFHGWSDAGSVASDTLEYLMDVLHPEVFASLKNEPFMHYTLDRPVGRIQEGIILDLESPITQFRYWQNPSGEHDLILVLGKEPQLNWQLYCRVILDLLGRLAVKKVFTIGGVQDTISHTTPPQISIVGTSNSVVADALAMDPALRMSEYYGPVSIHSFLLHTCRNNDMDAVSFWGHSPAYLQRNPRLVARIVTVLNSAIGTQCPVEGLLQKSIELDRKISEALAKDPSLREFVESIESKERPRPSSTQGEKVIRIDDFLRRDPTKDPGT